MSDKFWMMQGSKLRVLTNTFNSSETSLTLDEEIKLTNRGRRADLNVNLPPSLTAPCCSATTPRQHRFFAINGLSVQKHRPAESSVYLGLQGRNFYPRVAFRWCGKPHFFKVNWMWCVCKRLTAAGSSGFSQAGSDMQR